jgi:hypothetical protein
VLAALGCTDANVTNVAARIKLLFNRIIICPYQDASPATVANAGFRVNAKMVFPIILFLLL